MTPAEFAAKGKGTTLIERASAQSHFSELRWMLGGLPALTLERADTPDAPPPR